MRSLPERFRGEVIPAWTAQSFCGMVSERLLALANVLDHGVNLGARGAPSAACDRPRTTISVENFWPM